jgi:glycosyltransferase involved in cell wall biosynthesis
MFRIVHLIAGLRTGGAEMMLFKLLAGMDRSRYHSAVISLTDKGALGGPMECRGISVTALGMKMGMTSPLHLLRLIQRIRVLNPDLIQGWMSHGNIAAQFVGFFMSRRVPVLWNIRQSIYSLKYERVVTASIVKLCGFISPLPTAIIYNSMISAAQHENHGYRRKKRIIIPNGFDIDIFKPDAQAANSVRKELNIPNDHLIIGLIGRYDPMKDHATFLRAASSLLKKQSQVHFILAGNRVDWRNDTLRKMIDELDISANIHLLGERSDIPWLNAAMGIASSSSYTESFPNVIGEAMSCAVPCVATDVGGSKWLIGETGRVVPPRNHEALANAWLELIEKGSAYRQSLGRAARQRIIDYFSIDSVVRQYESLYENFIH